MMFVLAFFLSVLAQNDWRECEVANAVVQVSHAGQRFIELRESHEGFEVYRAYCLFGPTTRDGFEKCHRCKLYNNKPSWTIEFIFVLAVVYMFCQLAR